MSIEYGVPLAPPPGAVGTTLVSSALAFVGFSPIAKYRVFMRAGRVDGFACSANAPDDGTVIVVLSLSWNWIAGPVWGSSAVVSLMAGDVVVRKSFFRRIVLPAG